MACDHGVGSTDHLLRSWGRFYWSLIKANNMRIKTVMNHNQNDGLLKMIRRTEPVIYRMNSTSSWHTKRRQSKKHRKWRIKKVGLNYRNHIAIIHNPNNCYFNNFCLISLFKSHIIKSLWNINQQVSWFLPQNWNSPNYASINILHYLCRAKQK